MTAHHARTFCGSGVLCALMMSGAEAQSPAQPLFRTRVQSVLVDVLVTSGNRPVAGLEASDFALTDAGVAQSAQLMPLDAMPVNVVLALDVSQSVAGERLEHLERATSALLSALKPDDQAALVTFSNRVRLAAPLSKDRAPLRAALDRVAASGSTSLAEGLYAALSVGDSDAGRALVIVFSDGVDTASWLTDDKVIETVKRSDAVVYAAALRSRETSELLSDAASLSGGRVHEIERTQNLAETFLSILEEFRHRYLLTYTPTGVSDTGWHPIDVAVKWRRLSVRARPGYVAGW